MIVVFSNFFLLTLTLLTFILIANVGIIGKEITLGIVLNPPQLV